MLSSSHLSDASSTTQNHPNIRQGLPHNWLWGNSQGGLSKGRREKGELSQRISKLIASRLRCWKHLFLCLPTLQNDIFSLPWSHSSLGLGTLGPQLLPGPSGTAMNAFSLYCLIVNYCRHYKLCLHLILYDNNYCMHLKVIWRTLNLENKSLVLCPVFFCRICWMQMCNWNINWWILPCRCTFEELDLSIAYDLFSSRWKCQIFLNRKTFKTFQFDVAFSIKQWLQCCDFWGLNFAKTFTAGCSPHGSIKISSNYVPQPTFLGLTSYHQELWSLHDKVNLWLITLILVFSTKKVQPYTLVSKIFYTISLNYSSFSIKTACCRRNVRSSIMEVLYWEKNGKDKGGGVVSCTVTHTKSKPVYQPWL